MPNFQQFYQQNKLLVWVGGGGVAIVGFIALSNRGKSGKKTVGGLPATEAGNALWQIDKDLQQTNRHLSNLSLYQSAGASMSPWAPEFGVSDMLEGMAPGIQSTDTVTINDIEPTPQPSVPKPVVPAKLPSKPNGVPVRTGTGPGDFVSYFKGYQFSYPGDAADYAGLN